MSRVTKKNEQALIFPYESNYFACVYTDDRNKIAEAFRHNGYWTIRKIGWKEFEAMSHSAKLIIEAQAPVLIHGCIHPNSIISINMILSSVGLAWDSEFYDQKGNLIRRFGNSK